MMTKLDAALEHLSPEDAILQTHHAIYEDIEGSLILSKNTLLFIQEQGWRLKHYTTLLMVPYEHFTSITVDASHRLTFTTHDETFHIVTLDIKTKFIEHWYGNRELIGMAIIKGIGYCCWFEVFPSTNFVIGINCTGISGGAYKNKNC